MKPMCTPEASRCFCCQLKQACVVGMYRRRAKRLKKLNRLMTSTAAQVATDRFRKHTYFLVLTLMVAHVVCFVVLMTQIDARYQ